MPNLPDVLVLGVPLVVVVPLLVQVLRNEAGLPSTLAGIASIVISGLLLFVLGLQNHPVYGSWATLILGAIVYGLASSGAYSQFHKLTGRQ